MSETANPSDKLVFREPKANKRASDHPAEPWKLLIVDDEEEIHRVTRMALDDFSFAERPLQFISAYSGAEARQKLAEDPGIAVVLLDVVMETNHAGLDVARYVRQELNNSFVRIILRTGQPGEAPEREVITQYDINDYKEKTELTAARLFTVLHTSLSSYRDLRALETSRLGLERIIRASANIFQMHSLEDFAQGVLEQLTAVLRLQGDAMIVHTPLNPDDSHAAFKVLAGSGDFSENRETQLTPMDDNAVLDSAVIRCMEQAFIDCKSSYEDGHFIGYASTRSGVECIIYLTTANELNAMEQQLAELLCQNVAIAMENAYLFQNQKEAAEPSEDATS